MHDLCGLTRDEVFELIQMEGKATVVYRPVGGIGDAIMLLPTINGLRKQIGSDLLVVSCIDYIKPVFEGNPNIDYIFEYNGTEISRGEDKKDLGVLKGFGSTVYSYYHPCPASEYENPHNPYTIDYRGRTVATGYDITRSRQDIFCEFAGVECDTDDYQFDIAEEHDVVPEGLGNRYIVVQLRSHDAWRDYPRMKWFLMELVRYAQGKKLRVVTIDSTRTISVDGVICFTHLNLYQIFAIIKNSLLLIGPDTMGVHAKGAFGGHVLGLFGPTSPRVRLKYRHAHWMPQFDKCGRQYCWYTPCKHRFCLSSKAMRPKHIIRRVDTIIEEAEVL